MMSMQDVSQLGFIPSPEWAVLDDSRKVCPSPRWLWWLKLLELFALLDWPEVWRWVRPWGAGCLWSLGRWRWLRPVPA
tara:strand:+ start:926 stop:1159 length:234 start_codon:yes stop_codon:yes gene_type:complete